MCISNAWHGWYYFPAPSLPEQMPGETCLFRDDVWTQAVGNACEDKACCGCFFPFLKLLTLGVIRGLMSESSGCGNGWKMILRPKSFQVSRIPVFKASPKVNPLIIWANGGKQAPCHQQIGSEHMLCLSLACHGEHLEFSVWFSIFRQFTTI